MAPPSAFVFTGRRTGGNGRPIVSLVSAGGRKRLHDMRPSTQLSALASSSLPEPFLLAASPTEAPVTFEPTLPDTSALLGMGSVVILCVIAGLVWANEVVPVSRTKLAISKSRGEVKEYLDELKEGAETRVSTRTTSESNSYNDAEEGTLTNKNLDASATDTSIKPSGDGRDFERWLFSDWLNSSSGKAGRQKEPAIPILKNAKWNSGDNPVLVSTALILAGVIIASVIEKVGSQF